MFSQTFDAVRGLTDRFSDEHAKLKRINLVNHLWADKTCLAVARALLFNRLPEDKTFNLTLGYNWETDRLADGYTVVSVNGEDKAETFKNEHPDYERMPKHEEYLSKWMTCKIFVKNDINSAVIFVKDLDTRQSHMLMSLFPAYIKSMFESSPLIEEEKQLCYSLTKRTSADFDIAIAAITRQTGIEDELNEMLLIKFANVELERSIEQSRVACNSAKSDLDENIEKYQSLLQRFKEATLRYETLVAKPKSESTELVDYFKRHNNLQLVTVNNGTIKFYVKTTLEWFDLEFYNRAKANYSVYHFTHPSTYTDADVELLMNAIFSDDPMFKIRVCSVYALNEDVTVFRDYEYPKELKAQYLPNPHLQYHNCLGDYREPIRKAICDGDYIRAIEQCVASCQSVNIAEMSVTFHPFMKELFASTQKQKLLVDNDGNEYNIKEALEKLK